MDSHIKNCYPQRHNKFSVLPLLIAELEEEVGRKTESYQSHFLEMKIFDKVRAFLVFPVRIKV